MSDAANQTVLSFQDVELSKDEAPGTGFSCASFALERGRLALIQVPRDVRVLPLADLAMGLLAPASGRIEFLGRAWPERDADAQCAARGRIGRVFDGHLSSWLSNLDMDENLTLAWRMHREDGLAPCLHRLEELARLVHAWPLPEGRPAAVEPTLRRKLEWVRACLMSPDLLILERPRRGAYGSPVAQLRALVEPLRAAGTAVLWVATDADEWQDVEVRPDSRWHVAAARLTRVEKD